jgi:hypothetical protein
VVMPLVFLVSCTDDAEQLGVGLLDGQPVVVSAPCRSQRVASIDILLTEWDNSPGGGDDQVLWRAVAPERRPATAFVAPIGEAPEGFDTTIPLAEPLSEGREYTLYMQWHGGGGGVIIFRPDSLKPGRIKSEQGFKSVDRFIDYASEGCGSGFAEGAEAVIRPLR